VKLARRAPDGVRLYAIGDVHGRHDLLETMFGLIDADRAAAPAATVIEALLGDLIDRGPDSAGVIESAMARQASHGLTALRGNHDQYLIDAVEDGGAIPHWLNWGGVEALASYGVTGVDPSAADVAAIREALRAALPPAHLAFLAATPLTARFGDVLLVHAGIRPGVPLDRQTPRDLMMIREPFHSDPRDHGVIVVHGHTPMDEPVVRANRIGVDTRAYASGVLTCAVIEGDSLRFLTAVGTPGHWA
jgi:serine/threonine protein phosphatase 1